MTNAPPGGSRRETASEEVEVPLPIEEFDQRVELVVRVPKRPRDQMLAKALCEQRGWAIRPAGEEEDLDRREGQTSYVIEVRLLGSRWGAETGARQRLLEIVGRHVNVTIAGGSRVRAAESEPVVIWRVYRNSSWRHRRGLGWLASLRAQSGLADEQCTVGVPPSVGKAEVRERLGQQRLGGFEFDASRHDVRKSVGPKANEVPEERHVWWHGRRGVVLRLTVASLFMFYGWLAYDRALLGQLIMLAPVAVAAWFAGDWYMSNQRRPWLLRWAAGMTILVGSMAPGYMWHQQNPYGVVAQIKTVLLTFVLLALLWCVPRGCWFAVRNTWISKHAIGLLTVLVLPLPWVLPFVGSFLQFEYLEDTFGIPADSVSVPIYWTGASALLPVLGCIGLLLPPLALYGWARHFHWAWEKSIVSMVSALVALVLLAAGAYASMSRTVDAARRAARDAVSATSPAPYFGIEGRRVCVEPLKDKLSVKNGPLPADRPLLTFSTDGDVLYLWDPVRARERGGPDPVMSLRSAEVSTYVVTTTGEERCRKRT
ncbi:hypothetical protein [Streptomyces aureoverticillatus]|uniref:hypothetical protein n=1 Tax=Streptomyces aureoverticillatus TaxID=66871 RepID=UPI0013DD5117|nr:hypothetical protein [Streptomyces aureoverticillatus]QIB42819.1 hypothetical protein G3H79_06815 [Streptomyces aureoverticillatus]